MKPPYKKWTEEEEKQLLYLRYKRKMALGGIAKKLGRTIKAVKIKLALLKKNDLLYNEKHVGEKYYYNRKFFNAVKPDTILDLFAGKYRFWHTEFGDQCLVIDNDKEPEFGTVICSDSWELVKRLQESDVFFDVIDVDPYGTPKGLLEYAITHARKGIIITDGNEWSAIKYNKGVQHCNTYFKDVYNSDKGSKTDIEDVIEYVQSLRPDLNMSMHLNRDCIWRVYVYKKEG